MGLQMAGGFACRINFSAGRGGKNWPQEHDNLGRMRTIWLILLLSLTLRGAEPLLGTWANAVESNPASVIIKTAGKGLTVDVGMHAASGVYWSGPQPATLYSGAVDSPTMVAFRVQYKDQLGLSTVVGHLRGDILEVDVFREFTDGSGRNNYHLKANLTMSK